MAAKRVWVACLFLVGFAGQSDREADLRAVLEQTALGDTLSTFMALESFVGRHRDYWRGYYELARLQTELGDLVGARASYRSAAELEPLNGELHFLVTALDWQLTDFDAAWAGIVVLRQLDFDRQRTDSLHRALRDYADTPDDFDERLESPRLHVAAAFDEPESEAGVRRLRHALVRSSRLGLAPDASVRHALIVEVDPGTGHFSVALRDGEEALLTLTLAADFDRIAAETAIDQVATAILGEEDDDG